MIRQLALLLAATVCLHAGDALPKAADVTAALAGEWTVDGMAEADGDDANAKPDKDMPAMTVTVSADAAMLHLGPDSQIKMGYKVWAIRSDGIAIECSSPALGSRVQKALLVVRKDGVVFCTSESFRHGIKLHRTNGKPVGLPPSARPEEAKPAVPVVAGEIPKGFTVEMHMITLNRSVAFQHGDFAHPDFSSSSTLQMQVGFPAGLKIVGSSDDVVFTEAVTDANEDLIPKKDPNDRHGFARGSSSTFNSRIWVHAALGSCTRPARSIRHLAGTVPVSYEKSPGPVLELKPASGAVGKDVTVPGTDVVFTLIAIEGSTLRYRMASDAGQKVSDVEVETADGKKLNSHRSGSSGDGKTTTYERGFDAPIPADAIVRVRTYGETATVAVPFDFKDVPLSELPPVDEKSLF